MTAETSPKAVFSFRGIMMFMLTRKCGLAVGVVLAALSFASCANEQRASENTSIHARNVATANATRDTGPAGEFVISAAGDPKQAPKSGTANIQGTVFFNSAPVPKIEVKLCAVPNMFGDCIGEKHLTRTDENGQYLFADLEPKVYGALFIRIFDTKDFVFTGKYGFLPQKIRAEADKTFFVPRTDLIKADLRVLDPKPKTRVDGRGLIFKWQPYPDADHYTVDLMEFGGSRVHRIDRQPVSTASYTVEVPLPDGGYRLRIEAYNSAGVKIAQAGDGIEFTIVNGGQPK